MACGVGDRLCLGLSLLVVAAVYCSAQSSLDTLPSKLTGQPSGDELRTLQNHFFNLLDNSSALGKAENFTAAVTVLNSPDGQQLIKALVQALVPTIGRDDSRQLMHHFWQKLQLSVPSKVSDKLQQLEQLYNEMDSVPAFLTNILGSVDNSPVSQMLQEALLNVNATQLLQAFSPVAGVDPETPLGTRLLQLARPAVDKLLKDNNIDLQADAVLQLLSGLVSQTQTTDVDTNVEGKDTKTGQKRENMNPMAALLPLMGMLGAQGKGNGNIMETVMKLMGNSGGNNNIMEGILSMMGNDKKGGNNVLETVMGMINNSGGKKGGDNMMENVINLMGTFNNMNKQNGKNNIMETVVNLMTAGSGNKKGNEFAALAKMAMNYLATPEKKKLNGKENKYPKKVGKEEVRKEKFVKKDNINEKQYAKNMQKARPLAVLEPAILKLLATKSCHAKLSLLMAAGANMAESKLSGLGGFIAAAAPAAMAGLPGGAALLQEVQNAWRDLGGRDRSFAHLLLRTRDANERRAVARGTAPYVARVALVVAEPEVQGGVVAAVVEQARKTADSMGMKGMTLENWPQFLEPMLRMGSTGLPVQLLPLLKAIQEHFTQLLQEAAAILTALNGRTLGETTPAIEAELDALLRRLGSVEDALARGGGGGGGAQCVAQALCRVGEGQQGIRASIIGVYSTVRGLLVAPPDVVSRLTVLHATTTSGGCQRKFPCALRGTWTDLDADEHQEL